MVDDGKRSEVLEEARTKWPLVVLTASVPEVLYREGGLEGEGGRISSGGGLADDGKRI